MFIVFLLLISIALITITTIIAVIFFVRDMFTRDVPFLPIRKDVLKIIIDTLQLFEGDIFYDLGSGDARVLIHAVKQVPGIRAIGIENGIIPFIISSIKICRLPVDIRFENILNSYISDATHIYCYLVPNFLEKVQKKIIRECKKGTKIISCDYPFLDLMQVDKISISTERSSIMRILYIYTI